MKEINDNEIRIIGEDTDVPRHRALRMWVILLAITLVAIVLAITLHVCLSSDEPKPEEVLFDRATVEQPRLNTPAMRPNDGKSATGVTMRDTTVNDIPLTIFTPRHLRPRLHVGELRDHLADTTIAMALQAADIRADNQEIVSAFVLAGQTLARGKAKQGFCAIIDGRITLGVDEATPLYEMAVERQGDFFRQYPLVSRHRIVENNIKNKAVRRALAIIGGHAVVVTTATTESLHDFSQALVDIGAETAVNLVGGTLKSGWIVTPDTIIRPQDTPQHRAVPQNINYIIWSRP